MVTRRFSKHLFRAMVLIMLGVVLFTVAPANRAMIVPIPSPAASPTPVPTPETKRPNPLRRFFSSVFHGIAGVFGEREPEALGCILPPVVTLTPSSSLITLCPRFQWSSASNCSESGEVTLTADAAAAQDNKEFLFTWKVTAGRLRGEGQKVTWDLNDLPEGTYTASVEANDGTGHIATHTTTVKVATCPDCLWKESPCPICSVVCPASVESKQTTFEANVAGGDTTIMPTYLWSVSAGKIIGGQGTSKIVVDVSELAGKSLTATVKVGGYPSGCTEINVASCTTEVGQ